MEKTRKPTRNTARHDEAVDKLANMLWLGPKANEPIAEGFKTISEEMSQALTGINKRNVNLLSKLIPDLTDSETLLHMAAKMQWEDVVQALLDKGADPNARGSNGGTPMHAVAFSPLLRVISYERGVLRAERGRSDSAHVAGSGSEGEVQDALVPRREI